MKDDFPHTAVFWHYARDGRSACVRDAGQPSPVLRTVSGYHPKHGKYKQRKSDGGRKLEDCEVFTVKQYATVQGWPGWAGANLPKSRAAAMDLIGNSVPPQMVSAAINYMHRSQGEEQGTGRLEAAGQAPDVREEEEQEQAPVGQAPGGQAPEGQAPEEQAPVDQAPRGRQVDVPHPRREQAPEVQAPGEQAPADQAPRGHQEDVPHPRREQAPEVQAPREQAPEVQALKEKAPEVQAPWERAPEVLTPEEQSPEVQVTEEQASFRRLLSQLAEEQEQAPFGGRGCRLCRWCSEWWRRQRRRGCFSRPTRPASTSTYHEKGRAAASAPRASPTSRRCSSNCWAVVCCTQFVVSKIG